MRVYRRDGTQYRRAEELRREHGDTLRTPLLQGLEIPLARVFNDT